MDAREPLLLGEAGEVAAVLFHPGAEALPYRARLFFGKRHPVDEHREHGREVSIAKVRAAVFACTVTLVGACGSFGADNTKKVTPSQPDGSSPPSSSNGDAATGDSAVEPRDGGVAACTGTEVFCETFDQPSGIGRLQADIDFDGAVSHRPREGATGSGVERFTIGKERQSAVYGFPVPIGPVRVEVVFRVNITTRFLFAGLANKGNDRGAVLGNVGGTTPSLLTLATYTDAENPASIKSAGDLLSWTDTLSPWIHARVDVTPASNLASAKFEAVAAELGDAFGPPATTTVTANFNEQLHIAVGLFRPSDQPAGDGFMDVDLVRVTALD